MTFSRNSKRILSLLLALALLCALLGGCDIPQSETIIYSMDCENALVNGAKKQADCAPFVMDGVGYVPVEFTALSLGGSCTDNGGALLVSVGSKQFSVSETGEAAVIADGVLCYPVSLLCSALSLELTVCGGVFVIATAKANFSGDALRSYALRLGNAQGFTDKAAATQTASVKSCVEFFEDYTYEQMCMDIDELEAQYPQLITSFCIGASEEGRELKAFSFGRGAREIILVGSIHASEFVTTTVLMTIVDRYAAGYVNDDEYEGMSYRELLDGVKFIVVPMLNPDGVKIAQLGPEGSADPKRTYSMDLRSAGYYGWKANANGVDLNRNFPFMWWNANGVYIPSSKFYHGPSAGSESETQAMLALMKNTPYCMLGDFHIYGNVIYWDDDQWDGAPFKQTAQRLCAETGYADFGDEPLESFGGYLVNYSRNVYHRFSAVFELSDYWANPFSEYLFSLALDEVYGVPAVLADETLGKYDFDPALRVFVNGRNAVFTGERSNDGKTLTPDQLADIAAFCGGALSSDGSALERGGKSIPLALSDGLVPFRSDDDSGALDALEALGCECSLSDEGMTINISCWK